MKRVLVSAMLLFSIGTGGAMAETLLVANKSDHTVSFVDLTNGKTVATIDTGQFPHEVAVSPGGGLAVVTDYGGPGTPGTTMTVIDVKKRSTIRTIDLGDKQRPHGIAWLNDRKVAVTAEGTGHLLVVDVVHGIIDALIHTGQKTSHMVVATPDGERAFVANIGSGTVSVIDLGKVVKIKDIETGAGAEGIAISPDGTQIWVSNRAADTLTVIDPQTLEVVASVDCKGYPIRVAFTPDGKRVLVSCARAGEVAAFDVATRKEIQRAKLALEAVEDADKRLFGDAFGKSPVPVGLVIAGERAYVAATQADVIVVIDSRTLQVVGALKTGREPDGMALAG